MESNEILAAKIKELDNLKQYNVFEEVHMTDQPLIGVRWVVTEKFKNGEKTTKARLVAKGYQEKEDHDLRKDSPTALKESLRMVVALAISNQWKIKSLDIKSAFLQGQDIKRDLYLMPPPEAATKNVWKLKKTIYGLNDASRKWYLKVKETLEEFGMTMNKYDEALFFWQLEGVLEGLATIHVDDFFTCGTQNFENNIVDSIRKTFAVSKEENQSFSYIGIEMMQSVSRISLSQKKYIQEIDFMTIEKCGSSDSGLPKEEQDKLRTVVGQLAWVAGQTRPDIAFDVCQLSVNIKNAKMNDIKIVNKCIRKLKSHDVSLNFSNIGKISEAQIICFSDASFANLPGSCSQGGYIIFLKGKNGNHAPLAWKSKKIKRVVKSTLSAETMALLDGVENCFLLKTMLQEMHDENLPLPITAFVDSKSLKDAIYSSKTLEDKRLKIDICVLRDYLNNKELNDVCWVDTSQQLADPLTKMGANTAKILQVMEGSSRLL